MEYLVSDGNVKKNSTVYRYNSYKNEQKTSKVTKNVSQKPSFIRTISRGDINATGIIVANSNEYPEYLECSEEESFVTNSTVCRFEHELKINLTKQTELIAALHESASILKSVTNSDVAIVYVIHPVFGDIVKAPMDIKRQQICDCWKVGPGTIMAALVAQIKMYIITDNVFGDDRFPKGIGVTETRIKYAMSVPIMTPNHKIKAVLEFGRGSSKDGYTWADLNSVLATTAWIGNSIFYNELYQLKMKQLVLNQHLFRIITKHSLKFDSFIESLTDIMVHAKNTLSAKNSTFFLIIEENKHEFKADCYEEVVECNKVTLQKRKNVLINLENSAVTKAARTQVIVNVKDNKLHKSTEQFSFDNKEPLNTLCLPVVRNNKTLGVFQLINKMSGMYFIEEDEFILQNFSTYFLLLLDMLLLKTKFDNMGHELNVNNEILLYHIKPCKHDEDELLKKKDKKLPEKFMTFKWYPAENELNSLAEFTLALFHETLGENFMKLNNVPKFILTVKSCYRSMPYHNFEHAFAVTHTMANIICRNRELFSGIEKEALLIATVCHDLDHRGFNNNFIKMANHPISKLYQGSPMENHHFSMAQKIMEQCDMCIYMKPKMLGKLMKEIYDDIIFTDLSIYFLGRLQLVEALKRKQFSWVVDKFRYLIKGILMTACDLSLQTKAYALSKRPTYSVYKEFYNQGDIEKQMGLIPLPTMNRDNAGSLPECQVKFLSVVILPCYHMVATLIPNTVDLFQGARNLRNEWKKLIANEEVDGISVCDESKDCTIAHSLETMDLDNLP